MSDRFDIYAHVTQKIIQDLEAGVRPWVKPWHNPSATTAFRLPRRANGVPYKGINVLLLWNAALAHGFRHQTWMTYSQAQEQAAQVRKAEKGTLIVYADTLVKTEADDKGEEIEVRIPYLKCYTVFNLAQIDGLPESYAEAEDIPMPAAWQRIASAEAFTTHTGATFREGGALAYYAQDTDHIQMPPRTTFRDAEGYYATLLHELSHWTKHPTRLDRNWGRESGGDAGYAREELVAELSAAFLCAELSITPEVRQDHAAYIASWLKVLRHDKRAIFSAAALAQKAADYLFNLQASKL